MEGHIYKPFDLELKDLRTNLLFVGGLVEQAIRNMTTALLKQDSSLARKVIEDDDIIDRKENEIDEYCLKLLALRQPAARDLRSIATAVKINYDLERIGDMAANICSRVLELNEEEPLKPYIDLPKMAEVVERMVHESIDAFVKEDVQLAWKVKGDDAEADEFLSRMFKDVLAYMRSDPHTIARGARLLFIAKYMERMADHAVNIAELVIFMVEGRIIRHLKNMPEM